jgi:ankyrin repeat protein
VNNVPDQRIAALIDYTVREGTNRPISIATTKALGLGEKELPAMQLILGHKDKAPVHLFGFSTRNTNDVLVGVIDRNTRKGITWLTSLDGEIRRTILMSSNAAPKVVANDSHAREFQEQLDFFSEFIAQTAWEDAPHPLNEAAKFGSVSDVAGVLKHRKKALDKQDDEGQTPLANAVVQEQVGVVRFLLEQGADPNIPNKNGLTPLDHACTRNKAVATTLAKLLLDKGAVVNTKRPNPSNITTLYWAVSADNTELVKLLIEHGADIKEGLDTGETALHHAADRGDLEIAKLLIEHGADVNAKITTGWTPLHEAAYSRRKEMVELLLAHGADINAVDIHGKTPLAWAQGADVKQVLRQHGAK